MAIHRWTFRKGLRVRDARTHQTGQVAAVASNGVVVKLDNGGTLYLDLTNARLYLRTLLTERSRS